MGLQLKIQILTPTAHGTFTLQRAKLLDNVLKAI